MTTPSDETSQETIAAGGMDDQIRAGLSQAIAAVEAHQSETNELGEAEKVETAAQVAPSATPAPAKPTQVGMPALKDEPYEFAKCTISIGITLMPEDGNQGGRRVVIGVRDHNEAGVLKTRRMSDLADLGREIEAIIAEETASLEKRKAAKASKTSKPGKPAAASPTNPPKPAPKAGAAKPASASKPGDQKPAPAQITISFEQ